MTPKQQSQIERILKDNGFLMNGMGNILQIDLGGIYLNSNYIGFKELSKVLEELTRAVTALKGINEILKKDN